MEFDELSRKVIGCAIEVQRNLGPGLLESTYRQCLGLRAVARGHFISDGGSVARSLQGYSARLPV
jgi:GxxExxY protein